MLAIVWTDIVGLLAILAVCSGMFYLANRIEPHWVSKDGSRFLTTAQEIDQFGTLGRKREVRVHVDDESDALVVTRRSFMRPSSSVWMIESKAPQQPRGRVVFNLRCVSGSSEITAMALRVPARSKMLPRLEALMNATGASDSPGSPPADRPTDRD